MSLKSFDPSISVVSIVFLKYVRRFLDAENFRQNTHGPDHWLVMDSAVKLECFESKVGLDIIFHDLHRIEGGPSGTHRFISNNGVLPISFTRD